MCGTIVDGRFFQNKKLKNTGVSITESLISKRIEMLNNAKERLGYRNVWTLNGRINYLAEGCAKPQIFKNLAKVVCSSYGKNLWHEFLFCVCVFIVTFLRGNYHRKQFFTSKFIIIFFHITGI